MKSRVADAVLEAVMMLTAHTLAAKTFSAFWEKVSPRLAEGVSYIDSHEDKGSKSDKTFLEVITFRDDRLTRIIDGCLKEFLSSDVLDLIRQVQKIQDRITERKERINTWKLALISAPATSLMPLKVTRKTLERRIKGEYVAIEKDRDTIENLKIRTLDNLAGQDIVMTPEQLDGILYTAEGTELAQVMAVAEHIKQIQAELGKNLASGQSDQARTYTGFLMMCYRIYLAAIDKAVKIIKDEYLYRLVDIKNDANEQMWQADDLIKKSVKGNEIARNNLEMNARTIELAVLYEKHLQSRIQSLEALKKEMQLNYGLALNTFRTIKVGGELLDVINAGQKDLQCIFEFEPPQLEAFYDENLRSEFDSMTRRIKSAS